MAIGAAGKRTTLDGVHVRAAQGNVRGLYGTTAQPSRAELASG